MELRRYAVTCTVADCPWRIKCFGRFPRRAWSEFMHEQWVAHVAGAHPDVAHATGMVVNVDIHQLEDYREMK